MGVALVLLGRALVAGTSVADLSVHPAAPITPAPAATMTSAGAALSSSTSAPLVESLGAHRVLLVGDRQHMRRAQAAFASFGFDELRSSLLEDAGHADNLSTVSAGLRKMRGSPYYRPRGWIAAPSTVQQRAAPAAAVPAAGVMQMSNVEPQLVILGASYARGWNLEGLRGYRVVNKGISGQQSFELLQRFDGDVLALRPRAVILWGFINDIFRAPAGGTEAALERARQSFSDMISKAKAEGIEPILATEVTIRAPSSWSETVAGWIGGLLGKESYQERINRAVVEMNLWLKQTAERQNLLLLDLQGVLSDGSDGRRAAFALDDGSHISEAGYAALADYALPILQRHLAGAGGGR